MTNLRLVLAFSSFSIATLAAETPADPPHPLLEWVKIHPGGKGEKPSPRMGYETSYGYDARTGLLVRYGGHNQGGGGEQNSEVWTYDLAADAWDLREPNDAPPGVCCAQANVWEPVLRRFIRFPAFSGSHGWQDFREIFLKNSSVWTYDLDANLWRYLRPSPEPWPGPMRGAAYDPHHQVTVIHGGERAGHGTAVYDLYENRWTTLNPPDAPPAGITQPGFAYDPVHRTFVMFGYAMYGAYDGTWLYDLPKNTWRKLDLETEPPGRDKGPVLAADARHGGVLCSCRGEEGMETWLFDTAKLEWRKLEVKTEIAPSGIRSRVLTYLADRNLFVIENRAEKEQQLWTFRLAEADPPREGPRSLRCETKDDEVKLAWEPPPGGKVKAYRVHRGLGEQPWALEWARIEETAKTSFKDKDRIRGTRYFYRVTAVGEDGTESPPSTTVRTQPRVVTDLTVSVLSEKKVELAWVAPPDAEDLEGYHVERAAVEVYSSDEIVWRRPIQPTGNLAAGRIRKIGPYTRLTKRPVGATRFSDENLDLGAGQQPVEGEKTGGSALPEKSLKPGEAYRYAVFAYRVYAVNKLGVMSGPSPLVFTYPSAPQQVFSKEEPGGKARIRWVAGSEKDLKGYHVYRIEGKEDKSGVVRLTQEPVNALEYLDETSGEVTRRYEVVAVDALGQEGEPSQPVWTRREWREFYKPYVGEWHQ